MLLFGYVTFILAYPKISLWSILTAYVTVVGLAFLLAGILGRGKLFEKLKLIPETG